MPNSNRYQQMHTDLTVDKQLVDFIEQEALPGTGIPAESFWTKLSELLNGFSERNTRLLARRDELQAQIDHWLHERAGVDVSAEQYIEFLTSIGYLQEQGDDFTITTKRLDDEVSSLAGPQLVVPASNARYAINAANARWGSYYDCLYSTDALGHRANSSDAFDAEHGKRVVRQGKWFLDEYFPLADASHGDARGYCFIDGKLAAKIDGAHAFLEEPDRLIGYNGPLDDPSEIILKNNGLHVIIERDNASPTGRADQSGISDIILESALSTIVDFEDSVAAVDTSDKIECYRTWLGLMKGDIEARFNKGGRDVTRRMHGNRSFMRLDGTTSNLPGRTLLTIRNVGHLMQSTSARDAHGEPIFEGLLDAVMSSLIALHDLRKDKSELRNSRNGNIYIIKPKMHGPDEVAFATSVFLAVEKMLGIDPNTIKIGIMDEERRTSANLKECIRAASENIFFINTGFLDRTGDEIHTSMHHGAVASKAELKSQSWLQAYENRNTYTGLETGFSGRAQIGKGMWTMPDRMHAMLNEKAGQLLAGASTCWVPSPTAATLHATHYHQIDVHSVQRTLARSKMDSLERLLTLPAPISQLSRHDVEHELNDNVQSLLGYVVRWINNGIGCSSVPNLDNVKLMEDRATLRISSQLLANWLMHGIVSRDDIEESLHRVARIVDEQNAADEDYIPLAENTRGQAFECARALILDGATQPNGYTEPLLHSYRVSQKAAADRPS